MCDLRYSHKLIMLNISVLHKCININVTYTSSAYDSVAKVQFRTDAENRNRRNRTESSVQSGSGSPVLTAVQFSVLRILQNSQTV